jgi:hypothetical protein
MVGLVIGLIGVGLLLSVGYGQQKAIKRYSIATGGTQGTFYFVGAGISKIVHQYMPEIEIVVEATSASPENARLVGRGMADFALTTTEHSFTAFNGTGQYGKEEKGNVYFIRNSHIAFFQLVTNRPEIKTVYDLKGKRVAFGAPGSTTYMVQGVALMKAHGMTYADVKAQALHYGEAVTAMKDGNLDAALIGAGIPTAAIIDFCSRDSKARLVAVGEKEMKKMMEFDPYCFGWEIPANTYKGQTAPVLQPAIAQVVVANKNVPADVVYNITKISDQHTSELVKVHGVFKEWSHKSADLGRKIPHHPGAERYWKEVGLIK